MSPIIFAPAVFAAFRRRRCSRCGRKQTVKRIDMYSTVRCRYCGEEMSPPRALRHPKK